MNQEQQRTGTGGSLLVQVTTAGGAFPVRGAAVTVRTAGGEGTFLQTAYTDESGRTPVFALDTPPASTSLSPGSPSPYATYDIRVERDGFFLHENRNAPVFAGVYSIQNVDLIPVSPYGGNRPPAGSTEFSSEQSLNGGT